jgi:hypothetical protein
MKLSELSHVVACLSLTLASCSALSQDVPKQAEGAKTSQASAPAPCVANFRAEGSMWTGKKFSSFADLQKVAKASALDQVVRQVAADGWQIVNINKDAGLVSASRTVSGGNGKTVPLNVMISDGKPDGIHIETTLKASGGLGPSEKESKALFCAIFEAAAR